MGGAVRVAGTVRRAGGPWTPTIHSLLNHVNAAGVAGVPRPLGVDEQGDEVLSFIEGETVYTARRADQQGWPDWAFADELLIQTAQWLANYHRAVATFRPADAHWRSGARRLDHDEIVCHNDLRPSNIVVAGVNGMSTRASKPRLVGVLDWDFAGPGRPLWELELVAWNWIPLWDIDSIAETCRRLKLLADAYRHFSPLEILAAVPDRLDASAATMRGLAAGGDAALQQLLDDTHRDARQPASTELRRRLPELCAALRAA